MSVAVDVAGGEVAVRIGGIDRLWSLTSGVRVPLSGVRGAAVVDRRQALASASALRLPGTSWPGVIRAGSYGLGARRELWCVHRADRVLVLELEGQRYRRVVVEVPDAERVARQINEFAG
jgi:hypothetical protein